MDLWEILIPTKSNYMTIDLDTHKEWDKYVRELCGGLTILTPGKGQWIHKNSLYEEVVIPVRIVCTRSQIEQIIEFSMSHYKQISILAYKLSSEVICTTI